jgi:hypothetical protein
MGGHLGVAVLVRKQLSGCVSFVSHNDDGHVIYVEFLSGNIRSLVFGCYFPWNNSSNYCRVLNDTIGFIESLIIDHPGYHVCVLGDVNFECVMENAGYVKFFDFANAFNLVCCDDLNHSNVNYSYHHDTLGHFSLLDHVFVTSDLKACVANYSVVNDHLNPSDHLAVSFCLKHPEISGCVGDSSCVANPYVREFRWDRADLSLY